MLQFWCLFPLRVAYHGSFRENLESAFLGRSVSRPWLGWSQLQPWVACSFRAGSQHFGVSWSAPHAYPQSEWFITAHLERIWSQHFGALESSTWLSTRSKTEHLEMLQFWCLSPVRVAYHGSFRENLESAFWGFGVSYHNLIRQVRVFKTELDLQFWCLSPVRWLITAHLERTESAFWGVGVSYCSLIRQIQKKHLWSIAVLMPFWCLSPVRVVYHGSFRENLESAFWGLGLSYVISQLDLRHMQVFKTEHLKCCSFDASPQSEWLITAHLERIWSQHFGALECHITICKSSAFCILGRWGVILQLD